MFVLGWFGIYKEWDFGSGQLIENFCWLLGNVGVEVNVFLQLDVFDEKNFV